MHGSIYLDSSSSGDSDYSFSNRGVVDHETSGDEGKIFVGGLSNKTTEGSLRNYFSMFGYLRECTIMRDAKTKLSRGFAFVTFVDPTSVQKILLIKEHYLDGKKIDPQAAIRTISPARSVHNVFKKLFVGGVSQQTTVEDLKTYFEENFGKVEDVVLKVAYEKEGQKHRGFGFITFVDPSIADKVCEKRYHTIHSKLVETKQAQKKEDLKQQEAMKQHDPLKQSSDFIMGLFGRISPEQVKGILEQVAMMSALHVSNLAQAPPMADFVKKPEPPKYYEKSESTFRKRIAEKYMNKASY